MASKNSLIENITKRKISYKKRQKTFLKKAYELSTMGDAEMAIIVNSPYHDEPKVFPNHDDAINTLTKFRDLSASEKSINMETQEKLTKKRIKKTEQQVQNVREKNRVSELTNKLYEVLNEKDIPANMHPYDLNDLSYLINQKIKQVHEVIKMKIDGESSVSNAPQSITEMMVPSKTSFEGSSDPLSALVEAPVSMIPLTIANGTNSEGPRAPLFVPDMAPISMISTIALSIVPSATSTQVPEPMFHMTAPLMTFPQTNPLVETLWNCPSPHPLVSFSSQIFPPMVPQTYPPINLQMDLDRSPGIAPLVPSPMPLPMMTSSMSAPVFPPTTSQVDSLINIPPMDALMSTNNYQNYYLDIPQSPTFSEMLDWIADIDDSFFNNINVQDPNNQNNM